jgi:hypothetical protein
VKGSWGMKKIIGLKTPKFFGEMRGEGSANKGNADLE